MRVLVCGGREYGNFAARGKSHEVALKEYKHVLHTLTKMVPVPEPWNDVEAWPTIITGDAPGADAVAQEWAVVNWATFIPPFEADWRAHGRAAGPIRNQRMLDEGRPDLVIAFPGGRGTADMVRRARAAGVRVEEII